jgi:hypothetical protein
LQLTHNDLLQAQRVSPHWQHVITTSPSLQQKLFFQPEPASFISSPRFNPILEFLFAPFFNICPRASWDAWNFNGWGLGDLSWIAEDSRRAAIVHQDASWRNMFPVQPPAKVRYLQEEVPCCTMQLWESMGVLSAEFGRLQESGIRMGLLYDLVAHMVDGVECGDFLIDWKMFRPIQSKDGDLVLEGSQGDIRGVHDDEEAWNLRSPRDVGEVDDGEEALNEIHVGFSNSECHGRNPNLKRSALTIMDFNKALVSWSQSWRMPTN